MLVQIHVLLFKNKKTDYFDDKERRIYIEHLYDKE